jgi:GT2 family glycosyltransferase
MSISVSQKSSIGDQRLDEKPKVSVVITCFNHARFLPDSIVSALGQTWDDVEVIVIDDGSTDNTREVCSRFPAARYVWQSNSGLSAARNTGIAESKGEYICFLDADDFLTPDAVQHGLECFNVNRDCGFVFGGHRGVTSTRAYLWERLPDKCGDGYIRLLRGNYIGMHATVLYRKDVLEAVEGFDISLGACEDYDIYLRIARNYPIASHPHLVADYRQHDTNMSRDPKLMLLTSLSALQAQRSYVARDRAMRRAQKQGLRFWQAFYGTPWMKQTIATLLIPGRRRQALRDLKLCVRKAPWAVPLLARIAMRRTVSSAKRVIKEDG